MKSNIIKCNCINGYICSVKYCGSDIPCYSPFTKIICKYAIKCNKCKGTGRINIDYKKGN